jgi:hypothetical protein
MIVHNPEKSVLQTAAAAHSLRPCTLFICMHLQYQPLTAEQHLSLAAAGVKPPISSFALLESYFSGEAQLYVAVPPTLP